MKQVPLLRALWMVRNPSAASIKIKENYEYKK